MLFFSPGQHNFARLAQFLIITKFPILVLSLSKDTCLLKVIRPPDFLFISHSIHLLEKKHLYFYYMPITDRILILALNTYRSV